MTNPDAINRLLRERLSRATTALGNPDVWPSVGQIDEFITALEQVINYRIYEATRGRE